jgi:hypothetical protein
MHDPKFLAAVAKLPAPPLCEWMAAPLDDPGRPLGCFAAGNLLSPDFAFDAELPGDWIFAWSGTLAETLSEGSPMNWMRGPGLLNAACESLGPQLTKHGRRLLLIPHARHVLSDAHSALVWWCKHVIPGQEMRAETLPPQGERPFGLGFDPVAMIEESMLGDVEDHLRSLFGALGPRADAVILKPSEAIPLQRIRRHLEEHCSPKTPVLVAGPMLAEARTVLQHGR